MLLNCCSIPCEISCAAWRLIVCARKGFFAERNFKEKSPFVEANYRSIHHEISCELSSKNHENKEQNSRISLALLLHNTVCGSHLVLADKIMLSRAYLPSQATDQPDEFEIHVLDSGQCLRLYFTSGGTRLRVNLNFNSCRKLS